MQKNICVKCDSQWEKVSSWMHLFTERMYGLRHSAVKEFFNWKLMKTSISVLFHCLALHFTLYTSISVNLNREKSLVHHPAARCGAQTATALWSCHDSFTDEAGGGGKSCSLCARSPAICSFFLNKSFSLWLDTLRQLPAVYMLYLFNLSSKLKIANIREINWHNPIAFSSC